MTQKEKARLREALMCIGTHHDFYKGVEIIRALIGESSSVSDVIARAEPMSVMDVPRIDSIFTAKGPPK